MSSKGDLVVSLSGLSDLASGLRSIKRRMDDTGQVDRALGHGELGAANTTDALNQFMSGWSDGRKEIGAGIDNVAKMADVIVDQLTKVDEELKEALQQHQGGKKQ